MQMSLGRTINLKQILIGLSLAAGIFMIMLLNAGQAHAEGYTTISGLSPTGTIPTGNTVLQAHYDGNFGDWGVLLDGVDPGTCTWTYDLPYGDYWDDPWVVDMSCPVSGLSNGTHILTAWATDQWFGTLDQASVTFCVGACTADTTPPVSTDNAPAGWQNHDVTVTLSCSDGTGSGCASTSYEVDGGATQSGNSVPVNTNGLHTITYRSTDNAGNTELTKTATVKIDKVVPVVSNIQPSGTINNGSTTVSANFSDTGSGINSSSASLAVYGGTVTGCIATETGITCTVSGLSDGEHEIAVSVTDFAGNTSSSTGSFTVSSCQPAMPNLGLSTQSARWASYADYTARVLSVDYDITNGGTTGAYAVAISGAINTSGVTVFSTAPITVGDIIGGASAAVIVKYQVPIGVSLFKSTVYATASDACGSSYSYPGPMPGA